MKKQLNEMSVNSLRRIKKDILIKEFIRLQILLREPRKYNSEELKKFTVTNLAGSIIDFGIKQKNMGIKKQEAEPAKTLTLIIIDRIKSRPRKKRSNRFKIILQDGINKTIFGNGEKKFAKKLLKNFIFTEDPKVTFKQIKQDSCKTKKGHKVWSVTFSNHEDSAREVWIKRVNDKRKNKVYFDLVFEFRYFNRQGIKQTYQRIFVSDVETMIYNFDLHLVKVGKDND